MIELSCEMEGAVLRALEEGRWTEELREHAGDCSICADVALVASILNQEADALDPGPPLPDHGVIWLRAQLAERRRSARRATRVIDVFQIAATTGALAAAGLLAPWYWPRVQRLLGAARGSVEGGLPAVAELGQPTVVLLVSACLVLLLVLTGYYDSWVED